MIRQDFPFPLETVSFYYPQLQRQCAHNCISKALYRLRNGGGANPEIKVLLYIIPRYGAGGHTRKLAYSVPEAMELAV